MIYQPGLRSTCTRREVGAFPDKPRLEEGKMFYFQAQTGTIRHTKPEAPSNFYWYRLHTECLSMVEEEVEEAHMVETTLWYRNPGDFLRWLDRVDTKWDQQV